MRIAVTGANGFLGRAVVRVAEGAGHTVTPITRREADLATLDGADRAAAIAADCDATIHLAAMVDFTSRETWRFTRPNVVATALIAEACARVDRPLAYASAAVIAPAPVITPQTPDRPNPGYIASKLLGEQALLGIHSSATALRIGGIYGADGPRHLGLNAAMADALAGVVPTINGTGNARRNYVHVDDAARAMLTAVTDGWRGIHLIGGSQISTVREMLSAVAAHFLRTEAKVNADADGGSDMIVEPSPSQPPTRPFTEVIADMARQMERA